MKEGIKGLERAIEVGNEMLLEEIKEGNYTIGTITNNRAYHEFLLSIIGGTKDGIEMSIKDIENTLDNYNNLNISDSTITQLLGGYFDGLKGVLEHRLAWNVETMDMSNLEKIENDIKSSLDSVMDGDADIASELSDLIELRCELLNKLGLDLSKPFIGREV